MDTSSGIQNIRIWLLNAEPRFPPKARKRVLSLAGREGFEYHPVNRDPRLKRKTRSLRNAFSLAGREGFEYHPLNGDPRLKRKTRSLRNAFSLAGREGFEPSAEV